MMHMYPLLHVGIRNSSQTRNTCFLSGVEYCIERSSSRFKNLRGCRLKRLTPTVIKANIPSPVEHNGWLVRVGVGTVSPPEMCNNGRSCFDDVITVQHATCVENLATTNFMLKRMFL